MRPFRRAVAAALGRLPVSSRALGPPKGRVTSAVRWLEANIPSVRNRATFASAVSQYLVPLTFPAGDPLKVRAGGVHRHPPTFVVELTGARVAGRFATVIGPDDRIFDESIHVDSQYWSWDDLSYRWKLKRLRRRSGRWLALSCIFATGFHEWLTYCLPRIDLAARAGLADDTSFLLPFGASRWHWDSLEALGFARERGVAFDGGHWELERLVFPSLPSDRPVEWACEWLRGARLSTASEPSRPTRLYVSRRKARLRRVLNEDEILAYLEPLGFVPYCLEDLPFGEQAGLLARAEAVIGPHGAGLTNCVFSPPGCVVIEFMHPLYAYPCFYWQATACGHRYGYVVSEVVPQPGFARDVRFADLRVNIQGLRRLVETMLPA